MENKNQIEAIIEMIDQYEQPQDPWQTFICPNCGGKLLQFGSDGGWDELVCTKNTNVTRRDGKWILEFRPVTEDDFVCFVA